MDESRVTEDVNRPAFVNDPRNPHDELAATLGAEVIRHATSGQEAGVEARDEVTEEESGGPFVETSADEEFAQGTDESNPEDAEPAVLPRTMSDAREVLAADDDANEEDEADEDEETDEEASDEAEGDEDSDDDDDESDEDEDEESAEDEDEDSDDDEEEEEDDEEPEMETD